MKWIGRGSWALWSTVIGVLSGLALAVGTASAQTPAPTVWTGEPGTVESTGQIMAREKYLPPLKPLVRKFEQESEERHAMPQDPGSPEVAQWPAPATGSATSPALLRSPVARVRSGGSGLLPSFLGGTLADTASFPPDSHGSVGPTQYLMAINGRIRVFDKAGTAGALNTTLDNFFASVMTTGVSNFVCDPRARYDRFIQKWIVIAMDVPGYGSLPNRIVMAVSDGPTITAGTVWSFFQFQQDLVGTTPNADTGLFADYPTLGVDKHALYIGVNMFGASFEGTTGFVVRKSSLTPGGSPVVTAFRQLCTASSDGPSTPQGVDNDDPNATEGYFIGVSNAFYGRLILRRVSNPGTTPTISSDIVITVPSTRYAAEAPHKGNTGGLLDTVGDRLFGAAIHRNRITGVSTLATAHNIGVGSTGVATAGGRAGIRWYELGNLAGTPTLVQSGTIYDNAASNPNWYIIPTIAMSGQGRMLVGSTVTGLNTFPSVQVSERFSSTALGTMESTTIAKAGVAAYNPPSDPGSSRPRRWGDYSQVSVDPVDDMTLWTIQEYAHSANVYGVEIIKHPAPPPAAIASLSPSTVNPGQTTDITVTGTSTANSGFFDTDPAWSYANRLQASFSGSGVTVNSITFTSPTQITLNVTVDGAASSGARTLTITNPDGQTSTLPSALTVAGSTVVSVADATGTIGQSVTLSATLTDEGTPVSGKTISFVVGGLAAGTALTNGSGVATRSYAIPTGTVGSRTIQATFAGDGTIAAASGTGTLTAAKSATTLAVASGNAMTGQLVSLSATLTRNSDGTPVSGKSVSFQFNGVSVATGTTNASGTALVSYTVPSSMSSGAKTVQASFAGDADYVSTTGSNTWNVTALTQISPTAVSTTYLAKPTFKAVLKVGTTALAGRTVSFAINGVPVGTAVTNTSGLASLAVVVTATPGSHTWTASFAGDSGYAGSTADSTLTVGKGITTMVLPNVSVKVGATGIIKATLKVGTTAVAGVPVAFTLGGSSLGSVNTTSAGVASKSQKAAEPVGTLAITAAFPGDATYAAVSKTASWVVGQSTVKITADVLSATAGSSVSYGAVLRRVTDNAVLVGKTLQFRDTATSALLGTGTTNASGRATITLTAPGVGVKRNFTIQFAGDTNYAAGSGTGSLTGK